VGVNQVIMMSLNMVIIASMIGAGGLGYDVLTALRRLDIGTGLEAGLAIVALAIILDRQSQALAKQTNDYRRSASQGIFTRYRNLIIGAAVFLLVYLIACFEPKIASYPADFVMSARSSLNNAAKWITFNLAAPLDQIKTWFLLYLLIPFKTYIVGLPWFVLPILAALAGWKLSGPRLAAFCLILLLSIFVAGLQGPALTTIYLCGIGTLLSVVIGVPLGILGARNATAHKALNAICDTLQTLPSFVYLIPVVMLFKVGDFSALVAIVAYAVVPSIRYTDLGIRNVAHHMVEAGKMTGCTPLQILRRIELPLATPELILGISQTVMMALSMLVITALVGTRDLGQETYIALSKADAGRGLVAGFAIAFMAMVADRLLTAWSQHRCKQLGLT
jgi:glycine betaine/proline transport system permease protein